MVVQRIGVVAEIDCAQAALVSCGVCRHSRAKTILPSKHGRWTSPARSTTTSAVAGVRTLQAPPAKQTTSLVTQAWMTAAVGWRINGSASKNVMHPSPGIGRHLSSVPARIRGVSCTLPHTARCEACGCKGGPGDRVPNGKCVGWKNLTTVCGGPPYERCVREYTPVVAGCADRGRAAAVASETE